MRTKTNNTLRSVAELEKELRKARKEISLLYWMHSEATLAAMEMAELPNDEHRRGRALFLFTYIRHLGWHYLPPNDFRKRYPRLPGFEDYLAEAPQ